MVRKAVLTLFCAVAFAAASGCSTSAPSTHSWEASNPHARYKADNHACSPDNQPRRTFVVASEEFAAYKDCMLGLGYAWVALR